MTRSAPPGFRYSHLHITITARAAGPCAWVHALFVRRWVHSCVHRPPIFFPYLLVFECSRANLQGSRTLVFPHHTVVRHFPHLRVKSLILL